RAVLRLSRAPDLFRARPATACAQHGATAAWPACASTVHAVAAAPTRGALAPCGPHRDAPGTASRHGDAASARTAARGARGGRAGSGHRPARRASAVRDRARTTAGAEIG